MLNFLLAIALGNPFPSLKPLSPELPTEAGIDILLFWDGVKYKVFFPRETP
jgi:hypothetical protein